MRKILFLLFITLLLSACAEWERAPASVKSRHVVFDVDWTITSEVKPESKGSRVITVEGKKYFVQDGIEELVSNLLEKDIKVSFFSGGSYSRNHALLKAIVLSDGRTLEDIAFKILNREDLTTVPGSKPTDKFSQRYKKDLSKVSNDLSELIMIDDTAGFVLDEKQSEHVLFLGKTFEHFDTFAEAKVAAGEYVPRTVGEWSFARQKLLIINGAINHAFEEMQKSQITFSEAMKLEAREMNFVSGEWNDYSRGLLKANAYKSIPQSYTGCFKLMSPFLDIR